MNDIESRLELRTSRSTFSEKENDKTRLHSNAPFEKIDNVFHFNPAQKKFAKDLGYYGTFHDKMGIELPRFKAARAALADTVDSFRQNEQDVKFDIFLKDADIQTVNILKQGRAYVSISKMMVLTNNDGWDITKMCILWHRRPLAMSAAIFFQVTIPVTAMLVNDPGNHFYATDIIVVSFLLLKIGFEWSRFAFTGPGISAFATAQTLYQDDVRHSGLVHFIYFLTLFGGYVTAAALCIATADMVINAELMFLMCSKIVIQAGSIVCAIRAESPIVAAGNLMMFSFLIESGERAIDYAIGQLTLRDALLYFSDSLKRTAHDKTIHPHCRLGMFLTLFLVVATLTFIILAFGVVLFRMSFSGGQLQYKMPTWEF
jgi:hypothetical protein